jgi:hypothetical protein
MVRSVAQRSRFTNELNRRHWNCSVCNQLFILDHDDLDRIELMFSDIDWNTPYYSDHNVCYHCHYFNPPEDNNFMYLVICQDHLGSPTTKRVFVLLPW